MKLFTVLCNECNKKLFRSKRRINESKKLKWKAYCFILCLSKARNFQVILTCSRAGCSNSLKRLRSEIKKVNASYCSAPCGAITNNALRLRIKRSNGWKPIDEIEKTCGNSKCKKVFRGKKKYCSFGCIPIPKSKYTRKVILSEIRLFAKDNGRIPTKRDLMRVYRVARNSFGTWNNAIKAAGFKPNPVMFAKKHVANDGHKCDSLAEKIIDDWLFARKIDHKINVHYPEKCELTADYKVGDFCIEFFGLNGEHRRYDQLKRQKLKLVEKYNLKLIELYPKHLFPINKLSEALEMLTN